MATVVAFRMVPLHCPTPETHFGTDDVTPISYTSRVANFMSKDPKLIIHVIIFELTQHTRPQIINVTERRQTDRRTDGQFTTPRVSILASWYRVPRQLVNCVFPVLSFSLFDHIQWLISSVHDVRGAKIASQCSDDECKYTADQSVVSVYEAPTPWRPAMMSHSV